MDGEQQKREERDKERIYSISVTHTRTALCGGFFSERGEKEAGCGGLETDLRRRISQTKKTREYILI